MHGYKIINDKIWIHGAKGKFVQTSEKIIQQGDLNADTIIKETTYYKTRFGYNSTTKTYTVKGITPL